MLLSYCDDMPYSDTIFPNLVGHRTRAEAERGAEYLLLSVAESLLQGQCNPDIRMLACSVLAPRCQRERALRPCRAACEAARARCDRAFEAIDMAWPYFLDCDKFFSGDPDDCYDPLEGLTGELVPAGSGLCLFTCSEELRPTRLLTPERGSFQRPRSERGCEKQ